MTKKAFDEEPRRGPIEASAHTTPRRAHGKEAPFGGPANPKMSVRNARRKPQSFPDLRVKPNLTGTYVERHGRARLFVNQAGGHIEALITLVSRSIKFHEASRRRFRSLSDDKRLPEEWGYAGMLPSARKALAYRFCGDHTAGGEFVLSVPDWLGPKVAHSVRAGADGGPVLMQLGILQAGGDSAKVGFEPWFKDRWHDSAASHFGSGFLESAKPLVFERWDDSPVLLERYVARASVSFSARTLFWFGSSPKQFERLEGFANGVFRHVVTINPKTYELSKTGDTYDIYDLMKLARGVEGGPVAALQHAEIVRAADDIVGRILDEALVTTPLSDGGFTQSDKYLLREPIVSRLNAWKIPKEGKFPKQSVASVLQSTVDKASGLTLRAPKITEFLGITKRGYRQHIYEIEGQGFTLTDLATEDLEGEFKKIREVAKKLGKQAQKAIDKAIENADKAGTLLSKGQRGWKTYRRMAKFLPLAYSLGFFHVKYVGSQGGAGPQEEPWEAYFGFVMGGLDFARSLGGAKAKIEFKGTARQWGAEAMRPEDLSGVLQYLEGSAMLAKEEELGPSVVPDSVGGAVASLVFMGDLEANAGRQGVLQFVLDAKPAVKKGEKGGASGNIKGLWGAAWSLHDTEPGDINVFSREDEKKGAEFSVYWEKHLGPMAVFFPINGAHFEVPTADERVYMQEKQLLSPRQALDAFAAAELPLMINPLAVFKLEGFADAPGETDPNLELTGSRALTVAQYLEAILGTAWTGGRPLKLAEVKTKGAAATSAERIALVGRGEVANPGGDYNQADRRVDLQVRVEPPKNKADEEQPIRDLEADDADVQFPLTRETQ